MILYQTQYGHLDVCFSCLSQQKTKVRTNSAARTSRASNHELLLAIVKVVERKNEKKADSIPWIWLARSWDSTDSRNPGCLITLKKRVKASKQDSITSIFYNSVTSYTIIQCSLSPPQWQQHDLTTSFPIL